MLAACHMRISTKDVRGFQRALSPKERRKESHLLGDEARLRRMIDAEWQRSRIAGPVIVGMFTG